MWNSGSDNKIIVGKCKAMQLNKSESKQSENDNDWIMSKTINLEAFEGNSIEEISLDVQNIL